jgi:LysM repeat protein
MKKIKFLSAALAFMLTVSLGVSTAHGVQNAVIIEKGDTLWSISQGYDVTVKELLEWNPGITPHTIPIGTEIKIAPDYGRTLPDEVYHIVKAGDTLYSIANHYEFVELEDLYKLNPAIDPYHLQIGSEVKVRDETDQATYHVIEPGDTLYKIANLYENIVLRDLYTLNPDIDAQNLQIGSKVKIGSEDLVREYYTIKKGDTLFSISLTYPRVTLIDLYELNPGIDPLNLEIGSEIRVK